MKDKGWRAESRERRAERKRVLWELTGKLMIILDSRFRGNDTPQALSFPRKRESILCKIHSPVKPQRARKSSTLYALCSLLFASILYAQVEREETEAKATIDLPAVKIEIIDTTELSIPREKFKSFTKPDPKIYAPVMKKERPWYVSPTSVPEKLREVSSEAEKDRLFSLSASAGVPAALSYRMLLVRGFGDSEALLSIGRATLRSDRTPKLISDPSKGQRTFNTDRFRGTFAYRGENSNLKTDLQYNGRDLSYLSSDGKEYPNDRYLIGLSADWDQKISGNAPAIASLNFGLSNLRMKEPSEQRKLHSGLDLKTDFSINTLWPSSNPIDVGLGIGYFAGKSAPDSNSQGEDFEEAILKLYLRDNHIRLWPFVLGTGMELMIDARKSSTENWKPYVYLNPRVLLTSRIGDKALLQLGAEGYVSRQDINSLYLDRDYVRFNPHLNAERTWDLNTSLQYRFVPPLIETVKGIVTVGAFGKQIKNLSIFKEANDGVLSWIPDSRSSSARIFGGNAGLELSLIGDRIKGTLEYTHESHDKKEHIPYRPKDSGSLTVSYSAPYGLEPSISGEFYGARYVNTNSEQTLSSYSLLKPRISRTFGTAKASATAFISSEFYIGRDDYQIWKEYKLPSQTVDFGLTLKF